MSFLDALSPESREELEQFMDARIAEALQRRYPQRRWVTVRDAARSLGLSERAIRGRIDRGRIHATHHGRSVMVDMQSLNGDKVSE